MISADIIFPISARCQVFDVKATSDRTRYRSAHRVSEPFYKFPIVYLDNFPVASLGGHFTDIRKIFNKYRNRYPQDIMKLISV